jgi:pilus assembly protein CpaD
MNFTPASVPGRRGALALRLLAAAGCAAMLAGCMTSMANLTRTEVTGSVPDDYRQRHPIVVKEGPRTVELFIGGKRGALTPAQRAEVLAFAHEWRRDSTGGILIDLPSGTPNEMAAANALHEVRSLLVTAGVPVAAIDVRPGHPRDPQKLATLKLHYPRIMADAGPCGLWPEDLGPSYERQHLENREYWNLGCASQRNLAAMVDNPADLVQPRGETPSYTGRRTTVLDKYHRGESTATTYTDTDKGKISEVGK